MPFYTTNYECINQVRPVRPRSISILELLERPKRRAERERVSKEWTDKINREAIARRGDIQYTPQQLASIEERMDKCELERLDHVWKGWVTSEYLERRKARNLLSSMKFALPKDNSLMQNIENNDSIPKATESMGSQTAKRTREDEQGERPHAPPTHPVEAATPNRSGVVLPVDPTTPLPSQDEPLNKQANKKVKVKQRTRTILDAPSKSRRTRAYSRKHGHDPIALDMKLKDTVVQYISGTVLSL